MNKGDIKVIKDVATTLDDVVSNAVKFRFQIEKDKIDKLNDALADKESTIGLLFRMKQNIEDL